MTVYMDMGDVIQLLGCSLVNFSPESCITYPVLSSACYADLQFKRVLCHSSIMVNQYLFPVSATTLSPFFLRRVRILIYAV